MRQVSDEVGHRSRPYTGSATMAPSVLRRRSATAVGLYLSVALGLLGTFAAARMLGLDDFGRFATVIAAAGLVESLLDLTVEESLTKFGFRYVAAEDWGGCAGSSARALRSSSRAARSRLLVSSPFAPFADTLFGTDGLDGADARGGVVPLVADAGERRRRPPSSSAAATTCAALLLSVTMGLRLVAIARRRLDRRLGGARRARDRPASSRRRSSARRAPRAFRRFPRGAQRAARRGPARDPLVRRPVERRDRDPLAPRRRSRRSCSASSRARPRSALRVAQAPQSGLSAASSPVRLILLTEQTRDWEHGRERAVLRGLPPLHAGGARRDGGRGPASSSSRCRGSSASSSGPTYLAGGRRRPDHALRGGAPARLRLVEVAARVRSGGRSCGSSTHGIEAARAPPARRSSSATGGA